MYIKWGWWITYSNIKIIKIFNIVTIELKKIKMFYLQKVIIASNLSINNSLKPKSSIYTNLSKMQKRIYLDMNRVNE